jgi:phage shock protein E
MFFGLNIFKKINIIKVDEYKKMIDNNISHFLLDVRTEDEYKEEHIKGAILFPVSSIYYQIEKTFPNKNETYILYCRSGIRSQDAIKLMKSMGYMNVYDLGGILYYPYEKTT